MLYDNQIEFTKLKRWIKRNIRKYLKKIVFEY